MIIFVLALVLVAGGLIWGYRRAQASAYERGRADQAIAALETNRAVAAVAVTKDSITADSIARLSKIAIASGRVADSLRRAARSVVTLRGDTAVITRPSALSPLPAVSVTPGRMSITDSAGSGDSAVIVVPLPPEIAQLIRRDDELIATQHVQLTLALAGRSADLVEKSDLRIQHATDTAEIRVLKETGSKSAPRFGFRSGAVAGAAAAVAVIKLLAVIL